MKHDYLNPNNQRIVGQLVDREVLLCMSYFISRLAELAPDDEDLITLRSGLPDFRDAVDQNVDDIDWVAVAKQFGVEFENQSPAQFAVEDAVKSGDLTWEQVCDAAGIDGYDYRSEPYEFWAVTDWASEKLREQGETVVEVEDVYVWGRPTTGQSISMDHVWWEIADSMEILEGQRNDWSKK